MILTPEQQAVLNGEKGEIMAKVMKTLVMYGETFGADRLVPVSSQSPGIGWETDLLCNFYMTYICTNLLVINESKNQQYIRGTQENIELLQETKEKFIKELNQLLLDAEQCVLELCDLCLEKLMSRIEHSFFQKNRRICNYLRIKRLYGLLEIWVTR